MFKRIGSLLATAILFGGLLFGLASPTPVAAASNDRRIVYMSGDEGHVISIKPDGSDRYDYGTGYFPKLSPDGNKLAFSRATDDNTSRDLYTVNVDGTGLKKVSEHIYSVSSPALFFSWSPDSTSITFTTEYGAYIKENGSEYKQIATVKADGTGQAQLTNDPSGTNNFNPVWSPDGSKIAYTSNVYAGQPSVKVINADGTNPHVVADNASGAIWSPDNTKLAFGSNTNSIQVAGIDGNNPISLPVQGEMQSATWSPDGSRIALIASCNSCGGSGQGVVTVKPDGSSPTTLVPSPSGGAVGHPAWSPDSSKLIYTEYAPWESARLGSVPVNGGATSLVVNEGAGSPEWAYLNYLPATPSDTTPPVVTGSPARQPDRNGWYNHDVVITWNSVDPTPSSGTPTQPAQTTASQQGIHPYTSGQSCDPAGNCATGSLIIKMDKVKPTVSNPSLTGVFQLPFVGSILLTNTTTISTQAADDLSGPVAAEYYFDNDPGVGHGTAMTLDNNTVATASADVAGLHGLHTVYVRTMDAAGNWSVTASLNFWHL